MNAVMINVLYFIVFVGCLFSWLPLPLHRQSSKKTTQLCHMIVKKIGRFGKPCYEINWDLAPCDFSLTPSPYFSVLSSAHWLLLRPPQENKFSAVEEISSIMRMVLDYPCILPKPRGPHTLIDPCILLLFSPATESDLKS